MNDTFRDVSSRNRCKVFGNPNLPMVTVRDRVHDKHDVATKLTANPHPGIVTAN